MYPIWCFDCLKAILCAISIISELRVAVEGNIIFYNTIQKLSSISQFISIMWGSTPVSNIENNKKCFLSKSA